MLGHPAVQAVAASFCKQLELLEIEVHGPLSGRAAARACHWLRQYIFRHGQDAGRPIAQSRNASIKKSRIFASRKAARSIARHRQNYARATSWRRGESRAAGQILPTAGIRRDLSGDLAYFGYPFPAAGLSAG